MPSRSADDDDGSADDDGRRACRRRRARGEPPTGGRDPVRVVSADWVVPVEGEPIENGAVAIADDGTIAAVGAAADLGAGRAPRRLRDRPRLRQRALPPRVRRLRGLRRRAPVRALDRDARPAQGARSTSTTWRRSRPWVPTSACAPASRRRRLQLLRRGRDVPPPRRACARSSTSRSSAATRSALDRFDEIARPDRARCSPTASASASRRTRRTRARSRSTTPAPSSGSRRRRTSPRAPPSATGSSTARVTGAPWRGLLVPPPGETGIRMLAAEGLLGPSLMAAHCVHADDEEIELLARHGVGVAHCPRSNGYLGCGVAPLAELRAAGVAVSIATDSPASTPSLDLFEEIRSRDRRRARSRRATRRASRQPRRSSSPRSAARASSGWTIGSDRSCRASRPT